MPVTTAAVMKMSICKFIFVVWRPTSAAAAAIIRSVDIEDISATNEDNINPRALPSLTEMKEIEQIITIKLRILIDALRYTPIPGLDEAMKQTNAHGASQPN